MAKAKTYKLDKDMIERLALIMCSYEEIAMVMNTSVDNLKKRYTDVIEKGRAEGKKGLRRSQYEKAVKDNLSTLSGHARNHHRTNLSAVFFYASEQQQVKEQAPCLLCNMSRHET